VINGRRRTAGRNERRGEVIGLPEGDGWVSEGEGVRALDAGRPPESGGGGGRGGRSARGRDDGDSRDEVDERSPGKPEDRPWTPIPRQAKAAEPSLIPKQRRLKKTLRSA
jgi:hypothetical protein